MIPGDRVRLKSDYGKLRAGAEGVISGFHQNASGENVIVHFDQVDEMVPGDELEVVESLAPPRNPSLDWLREKEAEPRVKAP